MIRFPILALVVALTLYKPRISLYLLILASPLVSVYQEVGFDPRISWSLCLGIRCLFPTDLKSRPLNPRVLSASAIFFFIAAIVLLANLHSVPTDEANSAWTFFIYFFAGAAGVFAVSRLVDNERKGMEALRFLGFAGLEVAAYALWQAYQLYSNGQYDRVGSTLVNPNFLASYMNLCALAFIATRGHAQSRRWRLFVLAVIVLTMAALLLSLSRAGIIAFFAGLTLLWATSGGKITIRKTVFVAVVSGITLFAAFSILRAYRTHVEQAQMNPGQESLTEISQSMEDFTRYEAATFGLQQLVGHPLFGIGFELMAQKNYDEKGFYVTTHNTFLQLLVGTGLIGTVLATYIAKQLWTNLDRSAKILFLPVLGCVAANSLFADFLGAVEMMVGLAVAYIFCKYCSQRVPTKSANATSQ